jgi:hypothetical protein
VSERLENPLKIDVIRQLRRAADLAGELLPRGTSDDAIARFEERTRITVPDELRDWLKLTNGPKVGPGGLFGIETPNKHADIEFYLDLYPEWRERAWLPLASDGGGNFYMLPTREELGKGYPVLFVDTMESNEEPRFIAASGVWTFLRFLLGSELGESQWPFDSGEVLRVDPAITRFSATLPWDA